MITNLVVFMTCISNVHIFNEIVVDNYGEKEKSLEPDWLTTLSNGFGFDMQISNISEISHKNQQKSLFSQLVKMSIQEEQPVEISMQDEERPSVQEGDDFPMTSW